MLAAALIGDAIATAPTKSTQITFASSDNKSMILSYTGGCETNLDTCEIATKSSVTNLATTVGQLAARVLSVEQAVVEIKNSITAGVTHRGELDAADVAIHSKIDDLELQKGATGATGAKGTHTVGSKGATGSEGVVPRL